MKKTVAQKMRIKNNYRAFLVDAPKEAIDSLELPEINLAEVLFGQYITCK